MVKIAELISGKKICGDCTDNQWNNLFFIRLVTNNKGKPAIDFAQVVQFGDLQPVKIEQKQIAYSYSPGPDFVKSFRNAISKYNKNNSNLILP